ncbi:aminopeptidase Ey-like isoform X4 [Linepithema humile]
MIYIRPVIDRDFFKSVYADKEEDKVSNKEIIEVITAEELFPYWNESVFYSNFKISIWHHENYTVLLNMRKGERVKNINNMLWTHFDESLLLTAETYVIITSTYFYNNTESGTFWYRKEIRCYAENVIIIAQKVINYLNQKNTRKITKIIYFLIKNFQHSNIRNVNRLKSWGFILLREEDIIYNETLNQNVRKTEVANLIACATLSLWYDDAILWSREGFITFLAAHILDQISATYRIMDLFVVQIYRDSLRFDTLPIDSLPIDSLAHTANISTVHSFRSSFNYIKSFIIWRMLYHITSDDVFWTGINTYINIQNTTYTNNLSTITLFWIAMESARNVTDNSNLNMKDVIDISMERLCPVVNVTQTTDFDFIHVTVLCANSSVYNKLFTDRKQYRHMTYTTKLVMNFDTSDNKSYFWLPIISNYTFDIINLIDWHGENWIIFNLQQAGYYRVNYDSENWANLGYYLSHISYTNIHVLNRAQIVDDAFYFLMQGQLGFTMFFKITRFLFNETDYVAWYPMIKAVEHMWCVWPIDDFSVTKKKIMAMFNKLLCNIGYDDIFYANDFITYLREEAVRWSCVFGDLDCKGNATFELNKYLQRSVQDMLLIRKDWIYCNGLMGASYSVWLNVYEKFNKTRHNTLLQYLVCSEDLIIIWNYLLRIRENIFRLKRNERAYIMLLIVARHAKNKIMLQDILEVLKDFEFSSKKEVDQIAILIVIITHERFSTTGRLSKITDFVKSRFNEAPQVQDAVKKKIQKRISEYAKQIRNYGRIRYS